jgi:hypothetical protein
MNTFWTIVAILPIIWLIGFFIGLGELIHIRLVIAAIVMVCRLLNGRKFLTGEKRR